MSSAGTAVRLRWWPAAATATAASVSAAALLAALLTRRAELLILAAGPLALLAAAPRGRVPRRVTVTTWVSPARVAETDEVTVSVSVSADELVEHLTLRLAPSMPVVSEV